MKRAASLNQASSTLLLLITITFIGLMVYSFRLAVEGSELGYVFVIVLAPFTFYGAISSAIFLVLYPLGRLNKYLHQKVAGPESPFANERLPTQQIAPVDREEAR